MREIKVVIVLTIFLVLTVVRIEPRNGVGLTTCDGESDLLVLGINRRLGYCCIIIGRTDELVSRRLSGYVHHVVINVWLEVRNCGTIELQVGEFAGHRVLLNFRNNNINLISYIRMVRTNNEATRLNNATFILNYRLAIKI